MARDCRNCIHKNVCELYDIVQDPMHAIGCGNFLNSSDVILKSEAAKEIFEDIEKHLIFNTYGIATISDKTFDELKKKYPEEKK